MTENPYIRFERATCREAGRTTGVWEVVSRRGGDTLATIAWYWPWRQYVMEPELDTVFNSACLKTIVEFLETQNAERRRAKTGARV